MHRLMSRMTFSAMLLSASGAFAADKLTITIVNPDNNRPVANQELRVNAKGVKSRLLRTDENGKLTLPAAYKGKDTAIRCSRVPLMFDTRQRIESGMTVVLKHSCGGATSYK